MQSIKNKIFCANCGSENNIISSFCSKCGKEIDKVKLGYRNNKEKSINISNNIKNSIDIDEIDVDEINKFVSTKTDYYSTKFKQIESKENKITWNWAAFFFDLYWLLYRKMYIQAGAILLLGIIILALPIGLSIVLSFGLKICVGMYGNYIYLSHIKKKLADMNYLDYNSKELMITKKGGVNIVIPIIFAAIPLIIYLIGASLLYGALYMFY